MVKSKLTSKSIHIVKLKLMSVQFENRDYKLIGYKKAFLPYTNTTCIVKLGIMNDALVTMEHVDGKLRCRRLVF